MATIIKNIVNMSLFFRIITLLLLSGTLSAQQYEIDVSGTQPTIKSGHLELGGSNPQGDTIAVNSYYASLNNKPWIPVAGEFHFSRYPEQYWEDAILKMKAGGINVIATYVFWNMHEAKEGVFNWEGNKNLKHFIELCKANHIYVIVRVGPFCHGEIRSGGLPDWLMGKPLSIRSNDPLYLSYVEKLYNEIGLQTKGFFFKDNGPIIGIQIENEYQHSAAPWGLTYPGQPYDFTAAERDLAVTQQGVGIADSRNPYADFGNDHMKILKALAVKAGLQAPLYTATGWGNAAIIPNGSIPVTAAYAYPFWTEKKDLSPFFLYADLHKHPDYSPVRYTPEDYPAFAAELGSGIMSVYNRRPIAEHKSFDAMINRCLGSGANGIGYYMYHGGSTKKGESDEAYGLPKISYDFQAPIGEFGQVREGFHRLKLLHFFTNTFGELLAPMTTVLPANAGTLTPSNITDLRYAARVNGSRGFLFLNNFQDDTTTLDKNNFSILIKTKEENINVPGISIKGGENAILPFNLDMQGTHLRYATAQLLTKGTDEKGTYYVFFTPEGMQAEFCFSNTIITNNKQLKITKANNTVLVKPTVSELEFTVGKIRILLLPKVKALQSYQVMINGHQHLAFSSALILQKNNGSLSFISDSIPDFDVSIYPALKHLGLYTVKSFHLPRMNLQTSIKMTGAKKMEVKLPRILDNGLYDVILTIDYTGDTGMGFIDGELVADEFYKGIPWQIGLRKFLPLKKDDAMDFYFRPLFKDATYLADLNKSISEKSVLKINHVSLRPVYQTELKAELLF
jgi:hypothetical protein